MVRIVGIDLPKLKRIEYALMSIYGIGLTSSQSILKSANIDPNKRVHELEDSDVIALREVIEKSFTTEESHIKVASFAIQGSREGWLIVLPLSPRSLLHAELCLGEIACAPGSNSSVPGRT